MTTREKNKSREKKSRNCENEGAIVNGPYRAPYRAVMLVVKNNS